MPPVYPSKVTLRFLTRSCPWTPTTGYPDTWTASAPTQLAGVTLGEETYIDTALALFSSSGTPSNSADLQALTNRFAADTLAWRQTQFDQVIRGAVNVEPTGLADLEWDLSSRSASTRMISAPWNYRVWQLAHQIADPDTNCPDPSAPSSIATKTPRVEMYGPPIVSGNTNSSFAFDKYLVSLEDGRLKWKYEGQDTFDCGCQMINVTIATAWCACVAPGTITVVIKSGACPGGSTVAMGTADGLGLFKTNLPPGTYCASASTTHSGYLNDTVTFTVPPTGGITVVSPVYPDKLTITDSTTGVTCDVFPYGTYSLPGGMETVTGNAGGYYGLATYVYPGCTANDSCFGGGCPEKTVTVLFKFTCADLACGEGVGPSSVGLSWVSSNSGKSQFSQCPDDAGDGTSGFVACSISGQVCYPLSLTCQTFGSQNATDCTSGINAFYGNCSATDPPGFSEISPTFTVTQ